MKTKFLSTFLLITLIFNTLHIFKSCGTENDTVSCFPDSVISLRININLPAYTDLQYVGGWIYVDQQSSGTRGLIVVRTASGFKVYDRNAPHICPDTDTTLEVVDNIKIVCPADNAQWILLTGQPASVASIAPKTYSYSYDSSSGNLTIYN